MNKKDFAMRKIYLSYCYARNEKERERERRRAKRMDIPPSLFDLGDVHCVARSRWHFHLEIRTSRYASCCHRIYHNDDPRFRWSLHLHLLNYEKISDVWNIFVCVLFSFIWLQFFLYRDEKVISCKTHILYVFSEWNFENKFCLLLIKFILSLSS